MRKSSVKRDAESRNSSESEEPKKVCYENLEAFARQKIEAWLLEILEEEITEHLGREKSQRRKEIDPPKGYRNGFGKPRRFTLSCGTVTIRRPRLRDLEERFESRILPLFSKRTHEVGELIPDLYLHGLSMGDFDLALRGLLGDDAPLSENTVARLKVKWQAEYDEWSHRSLKDMDVLYLWVDGVYVKAGMERDKACLLIAVGGLKDGRKVFLAAKSGYRESTESWSDFLRDLKNRGINAPHLAIGDGNLGIWAALRNVYPETDEQRCWNHKITNVVDKVPKKKQNEARERLKKIPYAETRGEAEGLKKEFEIWCRDNDLHDADSCLNGDWERMVTFYNYPKEHWPHLRTTNVIESPFSVVRLRTDASKRYKKIANAVAVIWKVLMVVERRFNKLRAAELCAEVFAGARYQNGICIGRSDAKSKDNKDKEHAA